MKHKMVILTVALFTYFPAGAQINLQWAKSMGGTLVDVAQAATTDASGNVYTTGNYMGTADFDPGAGTFTIGSASFSQDVFISKLDAAGNFVWAKSIGGTNADYGRGIKLDASGNIYICGYFNGTADFDPGPGSFTLASSGGSDIFITKLDAAGNFVWAKKMGGIGNDAALAVGIDGNGNVYTTGYFAMTTDFDPGPGTYTLTSAGGTQDIFISKLDALGNFTWAKGAGGTMGDEGTALAFDASNNVYATGGFIGTVDFDPGPGTFTLASSPNWSDIFILKLDPSGNLSMALSMGSAGPDISYAIGLDASGNIYTDGTFGTNCDFDPGAGTYTLAAIGNADVFISKLNSIGGFVWAKGLGSTTNDTGLALALDLSGNVYAAGIYGGLVDFDPGPGTYTLSNAGNNDVFILKLNALGNFVWAANIGGPSDDRCYGISVDASNNVYTAGQYNGTVDFDPGAGTFTMSSAGNSDIFVHKINQSCPAPAAPSNVTALTSQTLCAGNSTTLSATGSGTINWYPTPSSTLSLGSGSNFITPTLSAGTYSYYAEASTCTVSARTLITVTVNPVPPPPANTTPAFNQTVCSGISTTLNASGSGTITWYAAPTSTTTLGFGNSFVTPTLAPGTYTYYAESTTCTVSVSRTAITLTVTVCTGIESNYLNAMPEVKIYPNPFSEFLILEKGNNEWLSVRITNALGQTVLNQKTNKKLCEFNVEHLPNGVYFVQIQNAHWQTTIKVIKE